MLPKSLWPQINNQCQLLVQERRSQLLVTQRWAARHPARAWTNLDESWSILISGWIIGRSRSDQSWKKKQNWTSPCSTIKSFKFYSIMWCHRLGPSFQEELRHSTLWFKGSWLVCRNVSKPRAKITRRSLPKRMEFWKRCSSEIEISGKNLITSKKMRRWMLFLLKLCLWSTGMIQIKVNGRSEMS